MQYKITNGSVSFGADTILEYIDFEIKDKEKIAIVGRNGCGKTTLLKAITAEVPLEEGTGECAFTVSKSANLSIGYLKQITFEDDSVSMLDELLKVFMPLFDMENQMTALLKNIESNPIEADIKTYSDLNDLYELSGGYTYKKEYNAMIRSFGFSDEDKQKPLSDFSGGQRTKIAFMKLLLSKPDVLLLDEPTNHLDLTTVEWLEDYLKNYKSCLVIVSHDRMFLNRIVGKVYEIEYGETKCYKGNYSEYERQKRANYEKQQKDHDIQRAEIQRLTKLIERFRYKATKAAMVQSKIKLIEKMKICNAPDRFDLKTFHPDFQPESTNNTVALTVSGLQIGYDKILAKVDFELLGGQKLGIIGGNGTGKSTLLKTLVGKIPELQGSFLFGSKCEIGYFDQQSAQETSEKTVFEIFHDEFPYMNEREVRSTLAAFQFEGEDVFKLVSSLSGGEKVRLALCKIFQRKPNLLVLDEPTNHMDIVGKESLEELLKKYTGTVIFVSHDRYFVDKIADCILAFEKDCCTFYPLTYTEYEQKKSAMMRFEDSTFDPAAVAIRVKKSKTYNDSPLKKKAKKERQLQKLEEKLKACESELTQLTAQMSEPSVYTDYKKIAEIEESIAERKRLHDELTEEWFVISENSDEDE